MFIACFISCGEKAKYREPNFRTEQECNFTKISEELYFSISHDLWEYKSYLILVAYDPQNQYTLHVFDKKTGKKLYSGLAQGRGPGETLFGDRDVSFVDGQMTYYDQVKKSKLFFNIDSLLADPRNIKEMAFDFPSWTQYVYDLGDNFMYIRNVGYASRDTSSVKRFSLKNNAGGIISEYDWFPIEDKAIRYTMNNFPPIAFSPDNSKMAIGSSLGAILETYSTDGTIQPINTKYFIEPSFQVIEGTYDYNENTILGFNDVFATNDKIYTAYDGEIKVFYDRGKNKKLLFTRIAIFDWNGTPLQCIRTNTGIERVCYSSFEKTLYALIEDKEGMMYIGKMSL